MAGFTDWLFGTSGDAGGDARARQAGIDTRLTTAAQSALQPYADLQGQANLPGVFSQYMSEVVNSNPAQYAVYAPTMTAPDALGGVNQFLDPSMQFQIDQATKAVQGSHAGRGGLFSGAAGQDISNATRQIAETGWGQAFDRSRQSGLDLNQTQQQNFQNQIAGGQFNLGLDQTRLGNLGLGLETAYRPTDIMSQGNLDLASQMYGTQSGMNQQQMQQQFADKGVFGDLLGTGANLFAAYLGGK